MSALFVDSSVWIDFFRGAETPETALLLAAFDAVHPSSRVTHPPSVVVGDLVLFEVLRGVRDHGERARVLRALEAHIQVDLGGRDIALRAAGHYRQLRALGVTVRKTVDCLIAAWCIRHSAQLLHNDRDFLPFVQHCGLLLAGPDGGGGHAGK